MCCRWHVGAVLCTDSLFVTYMPEVLYMSICYTVYDPCTFHTPLAINCTVQDFSVILMLFVIYGLNTICSLMFSVVYICYTLSNCYVNHILCLLYVYYASCDHRYTHTKYLDGIIVYAFGGKTMALLQNFQTYGNNCCYKLHELWVHLTLKLHFSLIPHVDALFTIDLYDTIHACAGSHMYTPLQCHISDVSSTRGHALWKNCFIGFCIDYCHCSPGIYTYKQKLSSLGPMTAIPLDTVFFVKFPGLCDVCIFYSSKETLYTLHNMYCHEVQLGYSTCVFKVSHNISTCVIACNDMNQILINFLYFHTLVMAIDRMFVLPVYLPTPNRAKSKLIFYFILLLIFFSTIYILSFNIKL
jgi:hypothetical protein